MPADKKATAQNVCVACDEITHACAEAEDPHVRMFGAELGKLVNQRLRHVKAHAANAAKLTAKWEKEAEEEARKRR